MGNRKSKKTPPEPFAPSTDNEGRGLSHFGSPYRYYFSEELAD